MEGIQVPTLILITTSVTAECQLEFKVLSKGTKGMKINVSKLQNIEVNEIYKLKSKKKLVVKTCGALRLVLKKLLKKILGPSGHIGIILQTNLRLDDCRRSLMVDEMVY